MARTLIRRSFNVLARIAPILAMRAANRFESLIG